MARNTLIQRSRGKSAVEKATFHQVEGKVLRKFFGLSDTDMEFLEKEVGAALERSLERGQTDKA